ncbi:hypothetical protein HK100_012585 [Physocladia obscura]|uniref:Uncharacterized protein n=1 Tax=Physocladia obscura TaxID=109957 RepID=A0AAD5T1A7_9FUNG|nr:hypothetical protein HK100_012585 [Physocladia obscura]
MSVYFNTPANATLNYHGGYIIQNITAGVVVETNLTALDIVHDIEANILSLVKAKLIQPSASTFFPVYLPKDTSVIQFSDNNPYCNQNGNALCYNVSTLSVGNQMVHYGVFPNVPGQCTYGCLSPSYYTTIALSNFATNSDKKGWYTDAISQYDATAQKANIAAVGTTAAGTCTNGKTSGITIGGTSWQVQSLWSNWDKGCVTSKGATKYSAQCGVNAKSANSTCGVQCYNNIGTPSSCGNSTQSCWVGTGQLCG